jgi:prefoldin subunit 5
MTRDRIASLEADKQRLQSEATHLQGEVRDLRDDVGRLGSENARLQQSLDNAESNSLVSTILIAVGGGVISYAAFTGNVAKRVADAGAGIFLAGAFLILIANARRWLGRRGDPS